MPRDVETLEKVIEALGDGASSELEAQTKIVTTIVEFLGLGYGAVWLPVMNGGYTLRASTGPLARQIEATWDKATVLHAGDGMIGDALSTRKPSHATPSTSGVACVRWDTARKAGAEYGGVLPVISDGKVIALQEFFSLTELPFLGGRQSKWEAITRIAASASRWALAQAGLAETAQDRQAITTVVRKIGDVADEQHALATALDTVRESFGWAYGSYWRLDEQSNLLRFAQESGSAGEEFRKVTLAASFAEGVGLSGRAWRARDLVFVQDLGDLTDCVRAPAAQRAGVRSGVCFPILIDGRLIGTMDFFTTETVALSDSRLSALRNVQTLVSQRLHVLLRAKADAESAQNLLDTVSRLREATVDAGRVAEEAVTRASAMTTEVESLAQASAAIGDVIKIISGIADQTNLLSLNATIEAARAGEVGRGFAVVASEVKDLARATASATQKVADQIAGIQESSRSVSSGIHATSEIIGQLDVVQARIGDVLEEQATMAQAFRGR